MSRSHQFASHGNAGGRVQLLKCRAETIDQIIDKVTETINHEDMFHTH